MAKATRKQALGRGLSALLKDSSSSINSIRDKGAEKLVGSILEIELANIEMNPFQPRTKFGEEELQELADSIKQLGVIQPITVRKLEGNKFQLVSGERRCRASKLAGLTAVPAYIRLANDQEMLEMALVENIQRKDLDPIEVAMSYQRLIDEINLTQEQMSLRVGKKRSTVTNYLRLLKLDPIIQTGMRDSFISMGHGRALINIDDLEVQMSIYQKILSEKLSVRQTEEIVKGYKENGFLDSPKVLKTKDLAPEYVNEGINKFGDFFGSNISVNVNSKGKGKISIAFNSEQDFERIKKLLEKSE
ncbi:MAG: ParB/RepB/Spo0J family partition protein [Flavobacteriaceae bacterium]|nr:ParB/RepB/Spo0J family partition protein [Flavobacteriaceae bacterium]